MKKLLIAFLLLPPIAALAQSYSIDWFTIDGGGGTSTGGVYSVSATALSMALLLFTVS